MKNTDRKRAIQLGCKLLLGLGCSLLLWASPANAGQLDHPAAKIALKQPAPFARLSASVQKQLKRGKRVVRLYYRKNDKGKRSIVAEAKAIIKAPPIKVYEQLARVEKIQEFMPNMIYSKIKKKLGPNRYFMHRTIKVLWTKIHMFLTVALTPGKRLTWHLDRTKKNGIKDTVGTMTFLPYNGGKYTYVTYRVYTDTGRAIPGFIRRMLIKSSLPNVLKSLNKRVMSGGRWKK